MTEELKNSTNAAVDENEIDEVRQIAEAAYSTANNAYAAANNALVAANNAQTTGNLAMTIAGLAQTQATNAQTVADGAQLTAASAYARANEAYALASEGGSGGFDPDVDTIIIGSNAVAQTNSVAIGSGAKCLGNGSIVLGNNAKMNRSEASGSIVIGNNALCGSTSVDSSIVIGDRAVADSCREGIAIGPRSSIDSSRGSIAIGKYAECLAGSNYSVVMGFDASAEAENSVVIGDEARVFKYDGVAIGSRAISGANDSIAIGYIAQANASNGIAIGRQSQSYGVDSIAIGHNAKANSSDVVAIGFKANGGGYANATIIGGEGTANGNNSFTITDSYLRCWSPVTWNTYSDMRDKTDINSIESEKALDFIELLNPVTYRRNFRSSYSDQEAHEREEKKGEHVIPGLCAQEVAEAFAKTYGIDSLLETHLVDFSAGFEYDKSTGERKSREEALKERLPEIRKKAARALSADPGEQINIMEILAPNSNEVVDESKFSLAYEELIPYLIGSIKHLNRELQELKNKME